MRKQHIQVAAGAFLATLVAGMVAVGLGGEAEGQTQKTPAVPRYADVCPHGHNGFNCETSTYRSDIADLQERVAALEKGR